MPAVQCPIDNCNYVTPDLSDAIVAALLTAHCINHTAAARPGAAAQHAQVEKVKRPTITAAGTTEEWSYFLIRWDEYVNATAINGQEAVVQLLECCEDQLRKDVTRVAGGSLLAKPIAEVIAAIRALAVREENVMVARVTLHNMRQDRDEPIRAFGARLRGQAGICKFLLDCPSCDSEVNYTEPIIQDILIRGIEDQEIQLDLLGHTNQNMTLEEVFRFVERKEAGKRSASLFTESPSTDASSSYKKFNRTRIVKHDLNKPASDVSCSYCGKTGHGRKAPASLRKSECPAFDKTCLSCNKLHHFASVCRKKSPQASGIQSHAAIQPEDNAVFNELCSVTTYHNNSSITLDHHQYDAMSKSWIKRPSGPQPFINLKISTSSEDYSHFGFKLHAPPKAAVARVMADTGCQSCLAGIHALNKLHIKHSDLIPVNISMKAANSKGINILGAVILRFTGTNNRGKLVETRQITYVTDNSDKIYLSKEGCIALGIISSTFPCIGEATQETSSTNIQTEECSCPQRQLPPPPPQKLPFAATEANREKLQKFLLEHYASSTFNTCEHQKLPMMSGPPLKLMIDPHAEPVAVHTPIPVPLHWQDEVKQGLDQDVNLGVLEQVPIGEPVTWMSRMVVCAKKNGKPRRTVDLQALNLHATRETHHTPSPFHQARAVPAGKRKTVLDAWNGYHSVPLRPEDRHLTTFITPWGRYRYCTAPQGYIASGDGYSRRYDELVGHIPNKTKCIDDTLLWADNIEESFFQTVQWLDICGHNGIILNPDKFVFSANTVQFAGFEITPDCVRPCEKYLSAIRDFPTPKNITDVRSWFGLINQVSYAFSMTKRMTPFRNFLRPGNPFCWDRHMDTLFEESKDHIIDEIKRGVQIYDKEKSTCLATDWSKSGIGFWLTQKHCLCTPTRPFCCKSGWKTTLIGSRFTHPAESRYAPIEGEALAVVEALNKTRFFVLGCPSLFIAVDHKPLLKIFGDRSFEDISNARLRNLKEKTLRYRFEMVHVPGTKHKAADTLSRHPTGNGPPMKLRLQDDIASMHSCSDEIKDDIDSALQCAHVTSLQTLGSVTWDKVQTATNSCPDFQHLISLIENGIPEAKNDVPPHLHEYHKFRHELYTVDGVVIYKDRIVIPPTLRKQVLQALHAAHQGITSMTARADSSVFWPGISKDLQDTRMNCYHCNRIAPSQPALPPHPQNPPAYPFQHICADFFHYKGQQYLVVVDRYSNWPVIERAADGATGLINSLRRIFATYGIADELSSDGGPEFSAKITQDFLQAWGVDHRLSSTYFPHSNCRAEVGVKIAKRLLTDNTGPTGDLNIDAFQRAVLQYRNTPDKETKVSPAMCIFGRPIKDFIPILPGKYNPHPTWRSTLAQREEALRNRHMRMAEYWTEHTKRPPPLRVGDNVRIQNQTGPNPLKWDKTGVVSEVRQFDQYIVRVDGSGRATLRNRQFLRKYIPAIPRRPRLTIGYPIPQHEKSRQRPSSPPEPDTEPHSTDRLEVPHPAPTSPTDATPPPSPRPQSPITPVHHPQAPDAALHDAHPDASPNNFFQAPPSALPDRPQRLRKKPAYLTDYDCNTY
ncbi:uncharacterized protein [Palaemon carinicauda]|uniref:uncharacterized protein n=1 Tax=Palaemon carinicauda TaxID=392227 RepID=UPI0035B57578